MAAITTKGKCYITVYMLDAMTAPHIVLECTTVRTTSRSRTTVYVFRLVETPLGKNRDQLREKHLGNTTHGGGSPDGVIIGGVHPNTKPRPESPCEP